MTNLPTLPETIIVDWQPYGVCVLADLSYGEYKNEYGTHPTLIGTVVEGTETSRIFQYRHTESVVGQRRTVYGIKAGEIDAGRIVRVSG